SETDALEAGFKTSPAVGRGFRAVLEADKAKSRVAEIAGAADEGSGGRGVVAADIGDRAAGIVAATNGDKGEIAGDEAGEFLGVELAAEDNAAVGEAQAHIIAENLALPAGSRAGEQQQIVAELLSG